MLHPLVLAAQAFPILYRTEDACAEQAVALRLEGAVVDRFRLRDLAVRPRPDLIRRRDTDLDLVGFDLGDGIVEFGQFVRLMLLSVRLRSNFINSPLVQTARPESRTELEASLSKHRGACHRRVLRDAPQLRRLRNYLGSTVLPCDYSAASAKPSSSFDLRSCGSGLRRDPASAFP